MGVDRDAPHAYQMFHTGTDDIRRQPGTRLHLLDGDGTALHGLQDAGQRAAHQKTFPIWKIPTARTQASASWIPTPTIVHRRPISRR